MATTFPIPASPKKNVITIEDFLGADFTNSPANADINKSPNLKNLIRDVPGKVRKCMGYELVGNGCTVSPFKSGKWGGQGEYIRTDVNGGVVDIKFLKDVPEDNTSYFIITTQGCDNNIIDALYEKYGLDSMPFFAGPHPDWLKDAKLINRPGMVGSYVIAILIQDARVDLDDIEGMNFGVYLTDQTQAPINGFFKLRGDSASLIHCGERMLRNGVPLYENANNHRSKGWEFDEHIYIIDGKRLLKYGRIKNKSDTKYVESDNSNDVVIDEDVTLTIKRFNSKQDYLKIEWSYTNSPNGRFVVSSDKKSIKYTDKLTSVGQDVRYYLEYKYRKTSGGTTHTVDTSVHHLIGIDKDGEYTVAPVEDDAYIPLVTISKDPEGGGEPYEDLNLLTPAFTEQFLGKSGVTDYNLSFDGLDEVEPEVYVLDGDGDWIQLTYGTQFTVNYETGVITFTTAPGVSPVTGEDNVKVTAYRTVEGYADKINHCTIGALFGVGGAKDRLFLSGNSELVNYDWYSERYNPTYFPDTAYSTLGSSGSAIIGYSIISNYLAAHKDKYELDQNIILREGDLVDSEPSFRIINTLQGAGAIAPYSFAYLQTEPLFLTDQGVFAVTAQDITGEKYAQSRSYFLDGKLLKEQNLEDAYGFVYHDMYWLCLNDVAYILDGLQPIQTDKSKPYATRQYVGFYRTNMPVRCMWENDNRLFFGDDQGNIYRFFNDKYALESYNDNGEPIECVWETPDIIGKLFFKNKTLRHVAVKLDSAIAASINFFVMNRGLWQYVKTDHTSARYFQFSTIVFSKFSFSCDRTQRTIPTKIRVKKVDKFRLKLTNDQLNEPFGLYDIGFEYLETTNYKG